MIVDSLMRRAVVTLPASASARAAAIAMRERGVGSIVVTDGGLPAGIVTEGDLARKLLAAGLDPDATTLAALMSRPLATIAPDAQVEEAARLMGSLRIKRLVVVQDGAVRGVLSASDIAYAEPALMQGLVEGWVKSRWEG